MRLWMTNKTYERRLERVALSLEWVFLIATCEQIVQGHCLEKRAIWARRVDLNALQEKKFEYLLTGRFRWHLHE